MFTVFIRKHLNVKLRLLYQKSQREIVWLSCLNTHHCGSSCGVPKNLVIYEACGNRKVIIPTSFFQIQSVRNNIIMNKYL